MIQAEIDTATVELVGVDGIAALWNKPRSGIYSAASRGKYGEPDWRVAVTPKRPKGVAVWLATRFGPPGEVDLTPYAGTLPPLLGMEEVGVCMGIQRHSVEMLRFRDDDHNVATPEPYATIGQTPVWWSDGWADFCRATNRPFYLDRLAEHRAALTDSPP